MFRPGIGPGRGLYPGPRFGRGFAHAPFFPGLGLLFGVLFVVSLALFAVAFWEILRKAGFDGPLGLVMLVPGLNVVAALLFAFVDWPVLKRLRALEATGAAASPPLATPTPPPEGPPPASPASPADASAAPTEPIG